MKPVYFHIKTSKKRSKTSDFIQFLAILSIVEQSSRFGHIWTEVELDRMVWNTYFCYHFCYRLSDFCYQCTIFLWLGDRKIR